MKRDPTKPIVILDLDGVLADCVGGVLKLFSVDPALAEEVDAWGAMPRVINEHQPDRLTIEQKASLAATYGMRPSDLAEVTRQYHLFPSRWPSAERTEITSKIVWDEAVAALGDAFWEKLDKYPWADRLVDAILDAVPAENVHLTTSPQPNPESWSGKVRWVNRCYPDLRPNLRMAHDKSLLAAAGRVLIDDGPHNTKAWEAAPLGGTTVCWPMPWNVEHPAHSATGDAGPGLRAVRNAIAKAARESEALHALSELGSQIAQLAAV